MTPSLIPNNRLKLADIPRPGTRWDWPGLQAFALSYDGYADGLEFGNDPGLDRDWASCTLSDMRGALFLAQRNWRHAEHSPDPRELAEVERLIDAIREKVRAAAGEEAQASGDLEAALRNFRNRFATWAIDLPAEDVRLRRAGFLQQEGWLIQYQFGRSGKTEYLDYHASHPMSGNEHVRLYASGGRRSMAAVAWSFLSSGEPEDEARQQLAFYKRNRRIARMLIAKGFDKATMNDFLSVGPADTGSERDVEDDA